MNCNSEIAVPTLHVPCNARLGNGVDQFDRVSRKTHKKRPMNRRILKQKMRRTCVDLTLPLWLTALGVESFKRWWTFCEYIMFAKSSFVVIFDEWKLYLVRISICIDIPYWLLISSLFSKRLSFWTFLAQAHNFRGNHLKLKILN